MINWVAVISCRPSAGNWATGPLASRVFLTPPLGSCLNVRAEMIDLLLIDSCAREKPPVGWRHRAALCAARDLRKLRQALVTVAGRLSSAIKKCADALFIIIDTAAVAGSMGRWRNNCAAAAAANGYVFIRRSAIPGEPIGSPTGDLVASPAAHLSDRASISASKLHI